MIELSNQKNQLKDNFFKNVQWDIDTLLDWYISTEQCQEVYIVYHIWVVCALFTKGAHTLYYQTIWFCLEKAHYLPLTDFLHVCGLI